MDIQKALTCPTPSFSAVSDEERLLSLEAQLAYAAEHSPFFRKQLHGRPIIGQLSDISNLPFTTDEDIRIHGREMVCVPASRIQRIVTLQTSGTSGTAKRLYFTASDLERTIRFFSEGMAWLCGSGDQVGILMPSQAANSVGQLLADGLTRIGVSPLLYGRQDENGWKVTQDISQTKPEVLVATPWQARTIALALPLYRPRGVLLSADCLSVSQRNFLVERWQCVLLEHYGMTESGLGCAVESPLHAGRYLRQDELIAEIVDPFSGAPLRQGQTGEIILTTLRREAMPLIRYRTGDLGCLLLGVPDRLGTGICRVRYDAMSGNTGIRMTDLDAALCTLSWIADYSAHWSARRNRMLLDVTVTGGTPPSTVACIEERLAELPFFRSIRLCIHINPKPWDTGIAIQRAKRCILPD